MSQAQRAPSSLPFDARPLVEPIDKPAVRAWTRQLRQAGRAPAAMHPVAIVALSLGGIVFLSMFAGIFGTLASLVGSAAQNGGFAAISTLFPLVFLLVAGGLIATVVTRMIRRTGERWYRLDRFARANGMTWHAEAQNPPLPGMIFGIGGSRKATDIVRGDRPRFVEFGNHQYTTGSGRNQTTHKWGYVAVHLTTPLPHIVLDALGNNTLFGSNLPASFDKDQRLSLEGDFDRYFGLYCSRGYERDALYLFTPDIMARFIDNAAALDVEIVDDWLFLYAKRDFSTLDPAMWAWLFSVVAALLDKFAQWERWRDERLSQSTPAPAPAAPGAPVDAAADTAALPFAAPAASLRPPPGVAPQGRRLTRRIPWGFIAMFGAVFLLIVLGQLGVLGSVLGGFFR